ncbi:MAG: deoxyribose-phosphate aldolase [Clostridiales bacterium]|nr:deoxyribose-phosphate aldolase [Clostridiales bacterium]
MKVLKALDIAKMIDHSLLNPTLTKDEVIAGCLTASKYNVASVCVKPCDAALAKTALEGSEVLTSTVIGFPHGGHLIEVKVFEAEAALRDGCAELDMVLNIGRLLARDFSYVKEDIRRVCEVAHGGGSIVKVIFENAYLTDEFIIAACKLSAEAGADFVKTSTGYAKTGATLHDLRIMRANIPDHMLVKAAGGVRTLDAALKVRAAGAARFGATATVAIMEEAFLREKAGTLAAPDDSGGEL